MVLAVPGASNSVTITGSAAYYLDSSQDYRKDVFIVGRTMGPGRSPYTALPISGGSKGDFKSTAKSKKANKFTKRGRLCRFSHFVHRGLSKKSRPISASELYSGKNTALEKSAKTPYA
jgi:hypothetical protein